MFIPFQLARTNTGNLMKPPRDYESLKSLIIENNDALPKRLRQVAVFALDNPDDIAFGTAASIAERADVQPSTLVRFAQSIGYGGFSDLQDVFRARLRERSSTYEERLEALSDSFGREGGNAILTGVIAAAGTSIDSLSATIKGDEFNAAVKLLARAETIYLLAQRRSFPVTSYLAYMFGKLKVRAHLVSSPFGVELEQMAFATKKDAAMAISFSPYASATIDHAEALKSAGVPTVSITDSAFSPLVGLSDIWLEVAESDFGGFRSLSATLALATALAIAVGEERRVRK
jgi:DNA-binding MurR/RpiR family transcriptional regulator